MLRTNSEYGSPYLVIWHVTLTFYFHFAQILRMMTAAAPLCGHGMMTQKGTSRNSCLVLYILQPSKFSLQRVNPLKGLGHRDEPFRMERWVGKCCLFLLLLCFMEVGKPTLGAFPPPAGM